MTILPVRLPRQIASRRTVHRGALLLLLSANLVSCTSDSASTGDGTGSPGATSLSAALDAVTAERLLTRTRALSDDSLEGRAPGTPGEDKTIAYLEREFAALGLKGGMPDGSFIQHVTLVGSAARPTASFQLGARTLPLTFPSDFVAITRHEVDSMDVSAEMVFVGYGVDAPEYGWNDYKDVDVKGKILVMLVNDPAVPDPTDSSRLDSTMFKGSTMTYYGRWTYKYEMATAKGAAGAIVIHEAGPAGYPYEVIGGGWSREMFDIVRDDRNAGRTKVESWITQAKAEELFKATGRDFAALKAAASRKDFVPVPLGATASFNIRNTIRRVSSRNVVATLPGSDPVRSKEYVLYSAHWDHLGRDTTIKGDQIFNGALDNASGVAQLLTIAEGFTRFAPAPSRSIMFVALTAEEQGLLGARYFAQQPPVPLSSVLANINMDGVNQWGRTRDITVIGYGNSTLDDVLADVLRPTGRVIVPDQEPEKGFFFRSDHFEFAKQGVPALYIDAGSDFIGKEPGYGVAKREEYTAKDYHKTSDEVKPDWDLAGAVEDARVLLRVGYQVAQTTEWPTWKPGTEFKAKRDSVLSGRR